MTRRAAAKARTVVGFVLLASCLAEAATPAWAQQSFELLRPASDEDRLPPFSWGLFAGRWTFEWDMPDSVLGQAGRLAGTETVTRMADDFYLSEITAEGPDGVFTARAVQTWGAKGTFAARHESDSRGLSLLMAGRIGDEGKQFSIAFESAPVEHKGQTLRLRKIITLTSPTAYRMRVQLSVDGGPFESLGSPWFRREIEMPSRER